MGSGRSHVIVSDRNVEPESAISANDRRRCSDFGPRSFSLFQSLHFLLFFLETVGSPTSSDVAEEAKQSSGPVQDRWRVAVMVALGPEDCATKVEFAAALKRAKEQAGVPVKTDTKMAAARERVSRLEKAYHGGLRGRRGRDFASRSNVPRKRHRKCLSQSKSERGRPSSNGQGNGSPESTLKFTVCRKLNMPFELRAPHNRSNQLDRLCRFRCRSTEVASDRGRYFKEIGTLSRTFDSSGCQCRQRS